MYVATGILYTYAGMYTHQQYKYAHTHILLCYTVAYTMQQTAQLPSSPDNFSPHLSSEECQHERRHDRGSAHLPGPAQRGSPDRQRMSRENDCQTSEDTNIRIEEDNILDPNHLQIYISCYLVFVLRKFRCLWISVRPWPHPTCK